MIFPRLQGPKRTLAQTVGVVVVMGALAWASVPFYDLFCRVTGYGGTTATADAGSDVILDKTITIRFDGSLDRDMPWKFKPVQREMEIRIGETGLAFFEATNPTDHPVAGSASYNVTPYDAGSYFVKIDCFCFTNSTLSETFTRPVPFTTTAFKCFEPMTVPTPPRPNACVASAIIEAKSTCFSPARPIHATLPLSLSSVVIFFAFVPHRASADFSSTCSSAISIHTGSGDLPVIISAS